MGSAFEDATCPEPALVELAGSFRNVRKIIAEGFEFRHDARSVGGAE